MAITSSIDIMPTSRLRDAYDGWIADRRRNRAVRAKRAQLVSELSTYRSKAERADMDAMLGRYPESETHHIWNSLSAGSLVAERSYI